MTAEKGDCSVTSKEKIKAMHGEYGVDLGHQCQSCCNFIAERYHDRIYGKCTAYGYSRSEASDWSRWHTACGLYGKDFEALGRRTLMELRKMAKRDVEGLQIEGQIGMDMG